MLRVLPTWCLYVQVGHIPPPWCQPLSLGYGPGVISRSTRMGAGWVWKELPLWMKWEDWPKWGKGSKPRLGWGQFTWICKSPSWIVSVERSLWRSFSRFLCFPWVISTHGFLPGLIDFQETRASHLLSFFKSPIVSILSSWVLIHSTNRVNKPKISGNKIISSDHCTVNGFVLSTQSAVFQVFRRARECAWSCTIHHHSWESDLYSRI